MIDAAALGLFEFGVKEEGLVGIFANNSVGSYKGPDEDFRWKVYFSTED